MDKIIRNYNIASFDEDLYICEEGIVFQKDMTKSVSYDQSYFDNYVTREGTEIAKKLNDARVAMATRYCCVLLDVGIGSGEFISSCPVKTFGYDINPVGVNWLKERNLYVNMSAGFPDLIEGVTCWDVIEHLPQPSDFLDKIPSGKFLFASIPVFDDLTKVRESKHFKPNEHYYYYSKHGFFNLLNDIGFRLLEENDCEVRAGREGVHSFAFQRR